MQKGDIITAVTISGEYVGKLVSDDVLSSFELENPRMILSNPQTGEMGFAKGIAVTGTENPESVVLHNIVFATATNDGAAQVEEAGDDNTLAGTDDDDFTEDA